MDLTATPPGTGINLAPGAADPASITTHIPGALLILRDRRNPVGIRARYGL